jgi:hypothetical protein
VRQSTYSKPHTFEEAKQWLAEPENHGAYDYEVKFRAEAPNAKGELAERVFNGTLMTKQTWVESVGDYTFMDDDGMGHQVTEDGKVIMLEGSFGGWIRPSQALRLDPKCAYVLWYNK